MSESRPVPPTIRELHAAKIDITGGMDSVDWVRELRDGPVVERDELRSRVAELEASRDELLAACVLLLKAIGRTSDDNPIHSELITVVATRRAEAAIANVKKEPNGE